MKLSLLRIVSLKTAVTISLSQVVSPLLSLSLKGHAQSNREPKALVRRSVFRAKKAEDEIVCRSRGAINKQTKAIRFYQINASPCLFVTAAACVALLFALCSVESERQTASRSISISMPNRTAFRSRGAKRRWNWLRLVRSGFYYSIPDRSTVLSCILGRCLIVRKQSVN